jgi:hypothetical protein
MRELIRFDEQQLETIYPMTRGQKLNYISALEASCHHDSKRNENLEDNLVKRKHLQAHLGLVRFLGHHRLEGFLPGLLG